MMGPNSHLYQRITFLTAFEHVALNLTLSPSISYSPLQSHILENRAFLSHSFSTPPPPSTSLNGVSTQENQVQLPFLQCFRTDPFDAIHLTSEMANLLPSLLSFFIIQVWALLAMWLGRCSETESVSFLVI